MKGEEKRQATNTCMQLAVGVWCWGMYLMHTYIYIYIYIYISIYISIIITYMYTTASGLRQPPIASAVGYHITGDYNW